MKVLRFVSVLIILSAFMMMQACGNGGGTSDTAGNLTLSSPTVADNGDGTSLVTVTATFTPPTGKSAQGVVITITATPNIGSAQTVNDSLTSGSNVVIQSFIIAQQLGTSTQVNISASIGGMKSGVLAIVPKFSPTSLAVPITVVNFDTSALLGADKFINFTGGTAPYSVSSSVPADINVSFFDLFPLAGGTLRIRLLSTNNTNAAQISTLTLTDSAGASVPITVNYFK